MERDANNMSLFASRPDFADIVPIPQDDGQDPLCSISYTEEYSDATSYLRALMKAKEYSDRALECTASVLCNNPAHYTAWLYRADTLFSLGYDLRCELDFLDQAAEANSKNYQLWHHRRMMVEKINDMQVVKRELEYTAEFLLSDPKNIHVWTYRLWILQQYSIWDGESELVETLLKDDVRNNSAWNHRYVVNTFTKFDFNDEFKNTKDKITLAPQNPSPWSYLRAIVKLANMPTETSLEIAESYKNKSTHALELYADICIEKGLLDEAMKVWSFF